MKVRGVWPCPHHSPVSSVSSSSSAAALVAAVVVAAAAAVARIRHDQTRPGFQGHRNQTNRVNRRFAVTIFFCTAFCTLESHVIYLFFFTGAPEKRMKKPPNISFSGCFYLNPVPHFTHLGHRNRPRQKWPVWAVLSILDLEVGIIMFSVLCRHELRILFSLKIM